MRRGKISVEEGVGRGDASGKRAARHLENVHKEKGEVVGNRWWTWRVTVKQNESKFCMALCMSVCGCVGVRCGSLLPLLWTQTTALVFACSEGEIKLDGGGRTEHS